MSEEAKPKGAAAETAAPEPKQVKVKVLLPIGANGKTNMTGDIIDLPEAVADYFVGEGRAEKV